MFWNICKTSVVTHITAVIINQSHHSLSFFLSLEDNNTKTLHQRKQNTQSLQC